MTWRGVLGTSVAPITVRVHASLESFRLATGRPWWVRSVSAGTSIDLVPAALLARPAGFDGALRIAVAELFVSEGLRGRPVWVRIGAARYFARNTPPSAAPDAEDARAVPVGRRAHAGDFRLGPARRGGAGRSLLRARVRENARLARRALSTRPASPPAFGCRSFGCCCGCVGVCRVGVCRRRDPEIALAQGGRVVARLSQRAEPAAQTGMPVAVSP